MKSRSCDFFVLLATLVEKLVEVLYNLGLYDRYKWSDMGSPYKWLEKKGNCGYNPTSRDIYCIYIYIYIIYIYIFHLIYNWLLGPPCGDSKHVLEYMLIKSETEGGPFPT